MVDTIEKGALFMKKLLLVLLVFLIVGGSVFAFDILSYPPALGDGGAVMLDLGVGWSYYSWFWSLVGSETAVPPIYIDAQYALPNIPISVGLTTAYWQYKYSYYSDVTRSHYLFVGTKADWHWGFPMNVMDVYTGLTLGYRFQWWSDYNSFYHDYYSYDGFDYGAHVGIHFYFTDVFGAMVETGYPFLVKAGVSFKFGGSGGSGGSRYVVNSDTLNVRSGPSADSSVVGVLSRNDRVEVIDKSGTWWKIRSGKIEGYVNSSYLK